jgi:limonene-1,2-epoxide hydrolase
MSDAFRPRVLHDAAVHRTDPQAVVEAFLGALAAADLDTAADLLDEHVTYVNVGLPALRGRRRTIGFLRPLARPGASFEVYLHAIATNAATVLTERTDVLSFGAFRMQFWVTGRFDVQDGRITLWRDSSDYVDAFRAFVRAVLGVLVPPLRPTAPGSADVAPGRH